MNKPDDPTQDLVDESAGGENGVAGRDGAVAFADSVLQDNVVQRGGSIAPAVSASPAQPNDPAKPRI